MMAAELALPSGYHLVKAVLTLMITTCPNPEELQGRVLKQHLQATLPCPDG